jgi:Flp pilus assembly protein TadG
MTRSARAAGHGTVAGGLRDTRGVSAIEFAIAAPFVLVLVLGTCEVALDMVMDATVQMAAQAASRYGITTTQPATGTRDAQAAAIVNTYLSHWTRLPNTTVTIKTLDYGSYGNVGTSPGTAGMGGLGDIVSYQITLSTPGVSGIPQLLGIKQLTFQRNYLVQNEK